MTVARTLMTGQSFNPELGKPYRLPKMDAWPETVHLFDEDSKWAVQTALAANRPLLISGEPGIGKSQLSRAVAAYFRVPFLPFVVNARSECSDLLYQADPVSRLAQAQVLDQTDDQNWRDLLAEERFVRPGPLWWAFDWKSARRQAKKWCRSCGATGASDNSAECCEACCEPSHKHLDGWAPGDGCVVLIDEIDKADSEFANGLLESLGNIGFDVIPARQAVSLAGRPPLIAITTNQERELPAAFIRRCLVLNVGFPPDPKQTPEDFLKKRGEVHFGDSIDDAVYHKAAELVLEERDRQKDALHRPGAAEYLDILRALRSLYGDCADPPREQIKAIKNVAKYSLRKQTGVAR
jgi:MoxR-like ATPase